MKRKIFRRAFILYLVVLVISILFINFYLTTVLRASYIERLKESLSVQVSIIADIVPSSAHRDLSHFCRKMKDQTGARVTVIDTEGRVLGDSDSDASVMENHADRPEFQQALQSLSGSSIRFSETMQYDLLYVAKKLPLKGDHKGFIRLAVPLRQINDSIAGLRLKINLAVILVFLFFGLILIWQTERIRKYVLQIADHAGALAHGLFKKRLYLEGAGEFTELAHNMNNMANELEESIRTGEEETNRLNVILKSIPDALLLINVHGTIELSNNAARDLFTHHQLDGRPFLEVVRSPNFLNLIDDVKKSLLSGSTEIMLDMPEEIFLFVRISPLFYQVGQLAGVVAIFHDTTQIKKLEQMRKDFVANVSHEIKTPVTAIQGFAETLLDGALHDEENAEKFLTTIKSHSMRLNRLVEDLLTISKIELGVITVNKTEIHLPDIIDNVINTVLIQAAEKNLKITKNLESGTARIHADRDRIEQILLNVVDNAIKFTDRGEIEIGLSHEGGKSHLYVKDTGVGIPEQFLSRLGERFFRVDPSRSRDLGGTGLGLAIVKHLVKAHGWEMAIESEVGEGTTVKIYL